MEPTSTFTPRDRDDALRRLRRLTAGASVMAAGGVALLGGLAAHTLPGTASTAGTAVASTGVAATTAVTASTTSTTTAPLAAAAPAQSTNAKPVAVSGGSR